MRTPICIFILLFTGCLYAHPNIATSLTYRHVSGNSYVIVYKTVRDCRANPLAPGYGLEIKDSASQKIVEIPRISIRNITLDKPSYCKPTNQWASKEGYEEHTYEYTIDLDTFAGGNFKNSCRLIFSIITCCRSLSLNTIKPDKSAYYECMMDRCASKNNSGPVFMNTSNNYMRLNQPNYHNVVAIDTIDHDLLIFEPFNAMDFYNQAAVYTSGHSPRYPVTPLCNVSGNLSCQALPLLQPPKGVYMDSLNGNMIFTPIITGEFAVVSYRVKEYRIINGVKRIIGYYLTDKQFISMQTTNSEPVLTKATFKLEHRFVAGRSKTISFATELNDTNTNDSVHIFITNPIKNSSVSITSKWRSEAEFKWTPECKDIRPEPYFFVIHFYRENVNTREFQSIAINIYVDPDLDIGNDTIICRNGQMDISSNINGKYKWNGNNSDSLKTFTATSAGKYWLDVTRNGCTLSDTIILSERNAKPTIDLGPDTIVCDKAAGSPVRIGSPGSPYAVYSWDVSSSSRNYIDFTSSGRAILTGSDVCGFTSDTINVSRLSSPKLQLPPDTLLCLPFSYALGASSSGVHEWLWNDLSTDSLLQVSGEGLYWAKGSNYCGADTDSIYIDALTAPSVLLGNDTIVCNANYPLLKAKFPNASTLWSTGDTTTTLQTTDSGLYYVTVSNRCGVASENIKVQSHFNPVIDLGKDISSCHPYNIRLDAYFPYCTYLWNNGANTPGITVNSAGVYWVKSINECGTSSDSISVVSLYPPRFNLGNDSSLKKPFTMVLDAGEADSYLWNTSAQTRTIEVSDYGTYFAMTTNQCGFASDSITISEKLSLFFPLAAGFRLYPNPSATGIFNIECSGEISEIRIMSAEGRLLMSPPPAKTVDLGEFPPGRYLMLIVIDNQSFYGCLSKI
jgi:hypothetical protein